MVTTAKHPAPSIPSSTLDPFSDEFLSDPLRFEAELRDLGPVVWIEKYEIYALARYAQVAPALDDWETFSSNHGVGIYDKRSREHAAEPAFILEWDPPQHTAVRSVHNRVLNPAFLRGVRNDFREAAAALVDTCLAKGDVDGIADMAVAFPLSIFPNVLGIEDEGRENLLPAASLTFNSFGPPNRLYLEAKEKGDKANAWLFEQASPGKPAPGGLADLIHQKADEMGHDARTKTSLVYGLLIAGLDTTMHALGLTLHFLANNPDQFGKLRADPTKARSAFEEAVRLGSPVQTFARHTKRDVDIEGVTLPTNSHVLLFLGSANRDPRRWDRADEYDIDRVTSGHVAFGAGVHSCVGQMVARLEGEMVLTRMAEVVSAISPTGAPIFELSNSLRGLKSLPLRLT